MRFDKIPTGVKCKRKGDPRVYIKIVPFKQLVSEEFHGIHWNMQRAGNAVIEDDCGSLSYKNISPNSIMWEIVDETIQ